jgi:hypothetical protein
MPVMAGKSPERRRRAFWALVRRQHFVVTHRQLRELGFTRHWIAHRVANGRLHRLWQGVYAVGRPDVTRHGLFMAAVLACGPGAALSHQHAAELLKIGPEKHGPIEVSAPRERDHDGILVHRRKAFEATRRFGIRVTTVVQTMTDMAPRLSRGEREAMIGDADRRRLIDPERLRRALDAMPSQPGVGILKQTLDRRTFVLTHTVLERLFAPIAFSVGLPKPLTQTYENSYRVDFLWPALGLVVETDGLSYHRTAAQQAVDLVRDHTHTAAGLTTLRFSHEQVKYEPEYVRATLATVARRLLDD